MNSNPDDHEPDGAEEEPPLQIEIEDSIDLHGFRPRDIPDVVEDYIEEALDRGFEEVRLIHGRGTGFQRKRVQQILAAHPAVREYKDAPAKRGGWGATVAWLRPRGATPDDD